MAFWNALSDVLRPRPMMHVTDATNSAVTTPYASKSTEVLAGSAPPTVEASETSAPMTEEAPEPSKHEKNLMLHLSNVSHGVNHFQNQMMAMLYPSIMAELGMSYMQVGVMSAICSALNSVCQGAYGFVTPFVSRCKVLGFGNFGIALGTLLSGLAGSYPMLVMARAVASVGSSAQHPVGYSILASYFPKNRAAVMALNTSASNIGTLVATPLATAMLLRHGLALDLLYRDVRKPHHGAGLFLLPRLCCTEPHGFWQGSTRPGLWELPTRPEESQYGAHCPRVHGRWRRP